MQAGLDQVDIEDLNLAVTEACANAIRHGSPEQERNTIFVMFFLAPNCVMVEIRDEGRGFDPSCQRLPLPAEMRDGGYGLHIMRQVVDAVEFTRRRGTVVRLVKAGRGGGELTGTPPLALYESALAAPGFAFCSPPF
jgi:serine/threonine-protein kinase RsbW